MLLYLDRPPAGWFVLDVKRLAPRTWDWVALLMDVDSEDTQNYFCEFPARSDVQHKDYSPEIRTARQCWVLVAGKHRSRNAALNALKAMSTTTLH